MTGGDCALIVFAKAPVPGYAKTRLAPALGPEGAAHLAHRLLDHAVDTAVAAQVGAVELSVSPETGHPAFDRLAGRHALTLSTQGVGDLGARMHRALERALQLHPRALLIGTDAPSIGIDYLRAAAAALQTHDAVLGPAADGGYTLIGLTRSSPALFDDMPWSTAAVLAETRRRLTAAGLRHVELATLVDIDEPDDLAHLPKGWLSPSAHGLCGDSRD